jgi:hypothetical protein
MGLSLSFTVAESNDNKTITVTDTTGEYNAVTNDTGWETGGATNPDPAGIDGTTHTLQLVVTITTADGTETEYDAIDLYDEFGPFTDLTDLVFALDCSMLEVSGDALGTSDDEFPDGIYKFVYIYDEGELTENYANSDILIEGRIRNAVYELYRTIPTTYNCQDCKSKQILDIIFTKAYYDSMVISAYSAREIELLNMLSVIERLVTNGSSYTW